MLKCVICFFAPHSKLCFFLVMGLTKDQLLPSTGRSLECLLPEPELGPQSQSKPLLITGVGGQTVVLVLSFIFKISYVNMTFLVPAV